MNGPVKLSDNFIFNIQRSIKFSASNSLVVSEIRANSTAAIVLNKSSIVGLTFISHRINSKNAYQWRYDGDISTGVSQFLFFDTAGASLSVFSQSASGARINKIFGVGESLSVSGTTDLKGDVSISGNTTMKGNLSVSASIVGNNFNGQLFFGGNVERSGTAIALPSGWTSTSTDAGIIKINHTLSGTANKIFIGLGNSGSVSFSSVTSFKILTAVRMPFTIVYDAT